MKTETAPVRLADYRAPDFAIDTVDLDFRLDPHATRVTARLAIRPTSPGAPLSFDGDELKLISVAIDGAALGPDRYVATPSALAIADVPQVPFTLEIVTEIDPTANTKLMGLYRTSGTWCTQCEAEGFRRITYFHDRPDVLAVYTTRIEAPKDMAPVLLANGNLAESGDIPGTDRHYAVWHDPFPKPSYLFALVAGDLGVLADRFTTMSGRAVALAIYCEHGKEARCTWAMDSLKRSMRWDETAFGREYDLDVFNIVAVSDFNMGAMENKGLNIFNDKYVLADPDTATDADYGHIEGVIAHEYFHNWTGDRITCRDWFQLCLKEGLTVFRDQEFSSDMRSRPVKRIADVRTLQARQFPEDAGPLAHPVRPETYHEINNFYTATVYEKGAEVVRMLKTVLGPDGFRAGMDLYFERHDGQAVTIEDFLAAFADATGADLTQFKLWYSQAGTPEVIAKGSYDQRQKTYALTLEQSCPPTPGQPSKQPQHIPVRFGLVGANGDDLAFDAATGGRVDGDVIQLTRPSQTIVFHGVSSRPVPSLLRGFSAPVKLNIDLPETDLLFLLRTDADPFNRWQAAQTLAMRSLTQGAADAARGEIVAFDVQLIDALADVAENEDLEAAFRAQVLQLPGEADIAREIGRDVDPDAMPWRGTRSAPGSPIGRRPPRRRCRPAGDGGGAVLAGRRFRRPPVARQRRHRPHGRRRQPGRGHAGDAAFRQGRQHDRPLGGARHPRRKRAARACRCAGSLPRPLSRRSAGPRQMADLRGDRAGGRDARPGARASRPPLLLDRESQPHPRAHRLLRRRQPDAVQPRGRRRVRLPRRFRRRSGPAQSADGGAPPGQLPLVAGAGAASPGAGREGAQPRGSGGQALPRRARHRHADAGLGISPSPKAGPGRSAVCAGLPHEGVPHPHRVEEIGDPDGAGGKQHGDGKAGVDVEHRRVEEDRRHPVRRHDEQQLTDEKRPVEPGRCLPPGEELDGRRCRENREADPCEDFDHRHGVQQRPRFEQIDPRKIVEDVPGELDRRHDDADGRQDQPTADPRRPVRAYRRLSHGP
jgi:aminopeptidase N